MASACMMDMPEEWLELDPMAPLSDELVSLLPGQVHVDGIEKQFGTKFQKTPKYHIKKGNGVSSGKAWHKHAAQVACFGETLLGMAWKEAGREPMPVPELILFLFCNQIVNNMGFLGVSLDCQGMHYCKQDAIRVVKHMTGEEKLAEWPTMDEF